MSNMYTILDSLKKVAPQQEPQENKKSQAIYESVEAKGSILEGVAKVEEKLKEQFAKFNEGDTEYKNGVTKHKGTYGTEYQGDPDDEDAPKRGRPAKGTAKKEKVVKVKGPKGRPKKDKPAEYSKSNDPFGRVPDKAPKGAKGTVIKGKATQDTNETAKNPYAIGMAQAKKETGLGRATAKNLPKSTIKRAHHIGKTIKANEGRQTQLTNMLLEGVNFTEMIKKKDLTLQEMLAELQNDIHTFKETGHCSELLRDCMEVHSFNKQQLNDATEKPMDNDNFPAPVQPSIMDRAKAFGGKVLNTLGHGSDEELKADLRRKMDMQEAAELNELARLAGLTVSEANDGNLANNAKPYDKVTQGDVVAGRLGKDEQGGKEEVAESDDDSAHFANILRHTAQKFAQKAHQGDDGQFWTDQAGIVMKASKTIDQQGMEAGMQVLNTCDCWDALGDELELHDIDVQDLVDQYDLDQHAAGDYRNFGSDYDGANEDPHGWDDEMGEGDMEEGNEFSGELAKAKAQHKDSFEVDGKTYPVKEGETCPTCHSEPCCCEDMEEADRELAKLKENCGITSPIGGMAQDMQQQQGRISVNTTQSSDGTKNINISADGEAADQLMQILKMAGMGGQQHAEVVVTAQPMEAKDYGNTDIDKPEEVLNTPRPDVRGMHRAETVGYADTTDDLNKQKDQDPATANRAANPKTPKANKVDESHPLESLGAKLMAEYQAIKITK